MMVFEIRVHVGGSYMVTFHLWIFEECPKVPIYKLEDTQVEPPSSDDRRPTTNKRNANPCFRGT